MAKSETVRKAKAREQVPNTILRDITQDIEKHVFPLTSGGQRGFDVLGKFYTEFIRYAGSDAKTGLVLTPQHITQLFCDVVNLNPNDVVIDPCCGTGGFLTSAMQAMWVKAGNNQEVKDAIKTKRIIGIERRVDMFTHACSNMMMRGDGKSNIFRGDCFDEKLRAIIAKFGPTVALLNPPYDVKPAGQLDFVLNALELLSIGGRCAAIVQMSAAIDQKADIIAARERLLKNHTLDAVMSMPHDVFYPAGPVTSVLVFRAKQPHTKGFKTYFGYWRDNGFVKRKHKGRVSDGTWPNKKQRMLNSYVNRETEPGFSVLREVTAEDEWCAEAYLETDYSVLTRDAYDREAKRYVLFNLMLETNVKLDESDDDT